MSQLTIKESQEIVDKWIKTVGVRYFSELTNLGQLVEEVGEVARIIIRTYGDQSFKKSEKESFSGYVGITCPKCRKTNFYKQSVQEIKEFKNFLATWLKLNRNSQDEKGRTGAGYSGI